MILILNFKQFIKEARNIKPRGIKLKYNEVIIQWLYMFHHLEFLSINPEDVEIDSNEVARKLQNFPVNVPYYFYGFSIEDVYIAKDYHVYLKLFEEDISEWSEHFEYLDVLD